MLSEGILFEITATRLVIGCPFIILRIGQHRVRFVLFSSNVELLGQEAEEIRDPDASLFGFVFR